MTSIPSIANPAMPLPRLRCAVLTAASLFVGGCTSAPLMPLATPLMPALRQALDSAGDGGAAGVGVGVGLGATTTAPGLPASTLVAQATATSSTTAPMRDALEHAAPSSKAERRFSLTMTNVSPEMLFMSLLNETPLSVAVDPAVRGPLSVTLKDVTLRESLDLMRELHGLEYKVIGRHIVVGPAQMQTRFFNVDYPSFNRLGRSELRVASGSISGSNASGYAGGGNANGGAGGSTGNSSSAASPGASNGGGGSRDSSHVSTSQRNDVWGEIEASIKLLVGEKDGRQVVVSAQTGTIIVRAMPRELRAVTEYLDAARISVQRQVMLEAKVVEVQLRDSERTGINWGAFKAGLTARASGGILSPGVTLSPTGNLNGPQINVTPGSVIESLAANAGSLLGLAFQTSNFAAVLEFLGTQGNTQVLSSPRIATMNNQKAVLKVGTDDYFVTNVSTTTTAVGNSTVTTPNITVQPFFSGISLDVTPHINAEGFITLHIHPAVTTVTERNKVLNFGKDGTYTLPLASSDINETDAVVRAHDGNIIAIGGLMRQTSVRADSGVPGTEGSIFRKILGGQTSELSEKRELVILLKPTIVDPSKDDEVRGDALSRLLEWTDTQRAKR